MFLKYYRNLDRWTKIVHVYVKCCVLFTAKVIFITLKSRFEGCAIVIYEYELFFVNVFIHLATETSDVICVLTTVPNPDLRNYLSWSDTDVELGQCGTLDTEF